MKAAILFKPNEPLQVLECELDPPKALEVRVKMKASGVCQSDWHVMNGDWQSPMPIVPGHEAAGEIVECGPGVTTVKPGDHVIFSFRPHCGRCRYCTQGRTVLCIGRASVPPEGEDHVIARLHRGDTRAAFEDFAGRLVTRHDRQRRRPVAVHDMPVALADARGLHFHAHFERLGRVEFAFQDLQRLVGLEENGGFHFFPPGLRRDYAVP